jgi:hypothetical protein
MKRSYFGLPNAFLLGFEPILVSGAVLAQAPTLQQTLLMVLDGLQPGRSDHNFYVTVRCSFRAGRCAPIRPSIGGPGFWKSSVLTNLGRYYVQSPGKSGRGHPGVLSCRKKTDLKKVLKSVKAKLSAVPLGLNKSRAPVH